MEETVCFPGDNGDTLMVAFRAGKEQGDGKDQSGQI